MTGAAHILEAKTALRARMKAWRATLSPQAQIAAGDALAAHALDFLHRPDTAAVVSGFSPMADELRVWALLRRLAAQGYGLAMPVMQGKGKPLLFRAWAAGDAMDKAVWGIAEPKPDKAALDPDIVLVPLLAFDLGGWRLGYGGGFYDRTLRELRSRRPIVAVGLAYDEQQVDGVPHLDYDERLDWVLRPSGPIRCEG